MKRWLFSLLVAAVLAAQPKRVLLDAHNCYPEVGRWADRIERALRMGTPLAIEQDLAWDAEKAKSFLSHEKVVLRGSPQLRYHFFERVRPVVETALESGKDKDKWPLVTLNLDFKTLEPEHAKAVYELLLEYKDWLTSAPKSDTVAALDVKPMLVLVGDSDVLEQVFNGDVPRVLAFGAAKLEAAPAAATPVKALLKAKATNYRRWVNVAWPVIEAGGQKAAAAWLPAEALRLNQLVKQAHDLGYLMRVYTLNGHDPKQSQGWNPNYNFGTLEAVKPRWAAARKAGVDFIATDQYEELRKALDAPLAP